jgi:hypothetical protein
VSISQRPGPAAGTLPRRTRFSLIPPTLTLALARLRQSWRLLLITELGLVGAVLLVSAVPLFSLVAVSSGLRSAIASSPGGPEMTATLFAFRPAPDTAQQAGSQIDSLVQAHLSHYLTGKASFSAQTFPFPFSKVPAPGGGAPQGGQGGGLGELVLDGRNVDEAAAHVQIVTGRMPTASTKELEVAVPQDLAIADRIAVGDTLNGQFIVNLPSQNGGTVTPALVPLHVVGIYLRTDANDPYWDVGGPFGGGEFRSGPFGVVSIGKGGGRFNSALVSADTLVAVIGALGQGADANRGGGPGLQMQMNWRYGLALDSITADDLDALTGEYNDLRFQMQNQLAPGIGGANLSGALDTLAGYQARAIGLQIVVLFLLLQVLGLVVLFVSLAAGILVERQGEAIAILRSRGAHRRHILGALSFQGLGASVVALVVGPLAAIPLVRLIAGSLLPADDQLGLSVLDRNPVSLAWGVRWYALVAVIGATIAIIVSILRAANRNVLALRRESARGGAPFWQRLNLDLIGAGFLIAIYIFYLWGIEQVPFFVRLSLSALAMIMPLLLLVAIALIFGRLFPLALRAAARLTARRSGAASALALAQMARSPREYSRTLLLFSLATAFALFTLILTVSQAAHIAELTDFQVGADFAGTLSTNLTTPAAPATPPSIADLTQRYVAINGVRSATVVYQGESVPVDGPPCGVVAIDPDTYATTALWSARYSSQTLDDLTRLLVDRRAGALNDGVVPAIVDDAAWSQLHLTGDGRFTLPFDSNGDRVKFIAVARVAHIPPFVDSPDESFNIAGGMLVDYQTFAAAYKTATAGAAAATLAPNTVLLRTDDDAVDLAKVRSALTTGALAVAGMLDRRQMLADAQGDPLQLDLIGALGLGAATALVLALVGAWTASWLNARSRLTSFAVLRALGTTPRQILSLLLWEQGIVYVSALALGVLLGLLFAQVALPALIFTSAIARTSSNGGPPIDVPPVQAILPVGELAIIVGGLALACAVAVAAITFVLSRASLGATLRLNQD